MCVGVYMWVYVSVLVSIQWKRLNIASYFNRENFIQIVVVDETDLRIKKETERI